VKPLLNSVMKDGSRHFLCLPETYPWEPFRNHITKLSGATVTGFVTDQVVELWIDFSFKGQTFSVNNQFGEYWFFAADPNCPDAILETIVAHCSGFCDQGK
jgi:hypothetical protein